MLSTAMGLSSHRESTFWMEPEASQLNCLFWEYLRIWKKEAEAACVRQNYEIDEMWLTDCSVFIFLIIPLSFIPLEDITQLTSIFGVHSRYSETLFSHFPPLDSYFAVLQCLKPQLLFFVKVFPTHRHTQISMRHIKAPREATASGF